MKRAERHGGMMPLGVLRKKEGGVHSAGREGCQAAGAPAAALSRV